jgi:hypothetical protein
MVAHIFAVTVLVVPAISERQLFNILQYPLRIYFAEAGSGQAVLDRSGVIEV